MNIFIVGVGMGDTKYLTKIAEETGMSRPSLYKALSEGAKPQFSTIMKVLKAVGGQIRVNPINA